MGGHKDVFIVVRGSTIQRLLMKPLIKAIDLRKEFSDGRGNFRAVDEFSYSFPSNGLFFILGKSGSGKSTLLFLLSGLEKPSSGELVKKEGLRESFVFQDENFLFSLNLLDNLRLINPDEKKIDEVLSSVGMFEKRNTSISLLSKGERARLAVAKALLSDADVIFLDEPTGNLDNENSKNILSLLQKLSKTILIICVTHDEESALAFADVILRLEDGKLVASKELKPIDSSGAEREALQKGNPSIPFDISIKYAAKKVGPKRLKFWLSLLNLSLTGGMLFTALSLTWVDRQRILRQTTEDVDIDYGVVEKYGESSDHLPQSLLTGGSVFYDELASTGVNPRRTIAFHNARFSSVEDAPSSLKLELPADGEAIVSDYTIARSFLSLDDSLDYYGVSLSVKGSYESNYQRYEDWATSTYALDNCLSCYVNETTFDQMVLASPISLERQFNETTSFSFKRALSVLPASSEKILFGNSPAERNDLAIGESVAQRLAGSVAKEQEALGKELTFREDLISSINLRDYLSSFKICGIFDDSLSATTTTCSSTLWDELKDERTKVGCSYYLSKSDLPLAAELLHQKTFTFTSHSENLILEASFVMQWADSLRIPFVVAGAIFLVLGFSFLLSYIGDNLRTSEKDIALFELAGKNKTRINWLFALTNSFVVLLSLVLSFGIGYATLWGLGRYNQYAYNLKFTPIVINYWAYAVVFFVLAAVPFLLSFWSAQKIKSYDIAAIFKRNLV
jgi:ABC-type lipoprotein export system ATPase subunit